MITVPQRTIGESIFIASGKYASKVALIDTGEGYSYAVFKVACLKIAGHFIKSGLEKGDRVIIYMNNSWQSAVSLFGITLAGGVFVFVNPQTKADKLGYIINDNGAKIIISEYLLQKTLFRALENTDSVREVILAGKPVKFTTNTGVRVTGFEEIMDVETSGIILPNVIPTDLAALIYTSGSTGFPKGVMMTHQAMVFTTWSLIEYLRLSEDDRIMLVLPLSFDYGLYQLLMSVAIGGALIIEQSFSFPATIYEQIEKYKPTVFPGVPTIFAIMINSHKKTGLSFDCVRKITNTAAALPSEFTPYLKRIFPNALIFKMYGLTECKRVCYLEPELIDEKPDSVGKAIPGTEVFILDPDGNPVPPGKPGILYIRGPHVMAGYWNEPELSDEMLKPGKIPGEKILCSHDLFKMDEDGFLYFLGRTDDIIKTRGEKVSPVEVENVIYKLNGVKEVSVIGYPDEILGEAITAFVTVQNDSIFNENEIRKFCMENSELLMVPQRIFILDEMPKTANGKIDKKKLKEMIPQIIDQSLR